MINFLKIDEACVTVLGVVYFIRELLKIVFIVVPIGLIVMLAIDFFKGTLSAKAQDSAVKIAIKRAMFAVCLFLVPAVTWATFNVLNVAVGDSSDCWSYAGEKSITTIQKRLKELQEQMEEDSTYEKSKVSIGGKVKVVVKTKSTSDSDSSDSSTGTYNGGTYDLKEKDKKFLAYICEKEQGSSLSAMKGEASIMANLYELQSSKKYSSITEYVQNSGWFGHPSFNQSSNKKALEAVESVLVQGNRTLPLYINEHDCWFCNHSSRNKCSNGNYGDICTVDGKSSKSYITKRSNYKKDSTVIKNVYGSTYTFYTFLSSTSDPFGYTAKAKNTIDKLNK